MKKAIWRLYDMIEQQSVLCESQEECEHMIGHWADDRKREFLENADDFYPFYKHIDFDESDSITPMGYECKLTALIRIDLQPWGAYIHEKVLAHYMYYHDCDEENEREKIGKRKKCYEHPTLEVYINGKLHRFTAVVSNDYKPSPTNWTDEDVAELITLRDGIESIEWMLEQLEPCTKSCLFMKHYEQLKSLLDDVLQPAYDDLDKSYREQVDCPLPEYQDKYCGNPEDCEKCNIRKAEKAKSINDRTKECIHMIHALLKGAREIKDCTVLGEKATVVPVCLSSYNFVLNEVLNLLVPF